MPLDSEGDAVTGPPADGPHDAGAPHRRTLFPRLGLLRRFRRARARHPVRTFVLTGLAAIVLAAVAILADASWQTYGVYRDLKGSMTVLQEAKSGLGAGHLPLTNWFPFLGEGSPQFLHYQSLPAILTGAPTNFSSTRRRAK